MKQKITYNIAGYYCEIFSDFPERIKKMLYGFPPFLADNGQVSAAPILQFYISVSQDLREFPRPEFKGSRVHSFDIEEGKCTLSKRGGKYRFSINGNEQVVEMEKDSPIINCILDSEQTINHNNLKFSLWMAAAFVGIPMQAVALHSSVIIYDNRAILFLGESGTGKSTHTKLWLSHISGSSLLNDDSPIVRIEVVESSHNMPFVYGSPWSGKGRCHLNERYPIAAFVRLRQHPENKICKLNKVSAFGALYPSFPPAFLKDDYFEEHICKIISDIIISTPVYMLDCLPDGSAAQLVLDTVFRQG